jgi:hypothetical protein
MDAPTTNRTQISTDIGNITCQNNTNTISALDMAYQQIKATNLPLALNTIVLFTDGSPNGINAQFPARAPSSNESRWGPASHFTHAERLDFWNHEQLWFRQQYRSGQRDSTPTPSASTCR